MTLYTGKKDFIHDNRDLRWSDIRPSGITIPTVPKPHGGFGMDFTDWLMLGNGPDDTVFPGFQGCGDCTLADAGHSEMEMGKNAGRAVPQFSGLTIVNQYSLLVAQTQGGQPYDPQTGANDTGLLIRDVLKYRQGTGLADNQGNRYKIGPYVLLEPGNLRELWEVLWFTEHVTIGVQLQQIQEDEFLAGQRLTYDPSSPTVGGHDELIVGHPVDGVWTGAMWGSRYTMTPDVITETCDEAWGYFDPEDISRVTGKNYEGYNAEQLQEYLTLIAQQFPTS